MPASFMARIVRILSSHFSAVWLVTSYWLSSISSV